MSQEYNKEVGGRYVKAYRERQKALGRRARLFYLTNEEFEVLKERLKQFRELPLG